MGSIPVWADPSGPFTKPRTAGVRAGSNAAHQCEIMTDRGSTGRDSGFALARAVRAKGSLPCGSVTGNSRGCEGLPHSGRSRAMNMSGKSAWNAECKLLILRGKVSRFCAGALMHRQTNALVLLEAGAGLPPGTYKCPVARSRAGLEVDASTRPSSVPRNSQPFM
jgi:hypothetical protein